MLCERCHKREATMHVVCVVNNKQIDKWLCAQCARELAPDNVIDVTSDSMKEFLECDVAEICATLNLSQSDYWQCMSRARKRLQICLNTRWFEKETT